MVSDLDIDALARDYEGRAADWVDLIERGRDAASYHREQLDEAKRNDRKAASSHKMSEQVGKRLGAVALRDNPQKMAAERSQMRPFLDHPMSYLGASPITTHSWAGIRNFGINPFNWGSVGLSRSSVFDRVETALKRGNYAAAEKFLNRARPGKWRKALFMLTGKRHHIATINEDIDKAIQIAWQYKAAKLKDEALKKGLKENDRMLAHAIGKMVNKPGFETYLKRLEDSNPGDHTLTVLRTCLQAAHTDRGSQRALRRILETSHHLFDSDKLKDILNRDEAAVLKESRASAENLLLAKARSRAADRFASAIERERDFELRGLHAYKRHDFTDLLDKTKTGGVMEADREALYKKAVENRKGWQNLGILKNDLLDMRMPNFDPDKLRKHMGAFAAVGMKGGELTGAFARATGGAVKDGAVYVAKQAYNRAYIDTGAQSRVNKGFSAAANGLNASVDAVSRRLGDLAHTAMMSNAVINLAALTGDVWKTSGGYKPAPSMRSQQQTASATTDPGLVQPQPQPT